MILMQTWAMTVDAYRELNTKKLFWITMLLSVLVVLAFAAIGNNDRGLTLFTWTFEIPFLSTDMMSRETLYKLAFVNFGITFWLAWIATILALVSTSSIFPDFIAGGSIETTLSKPISRTRLFFTKYILGLLFVGMQVLVFTTASFLVIGIRGGAWEPALFLAVPVVVIFFSYLFSVCTLLGLITRSTIASLLITLLMWFFLFCLNSTDNIIQSFRIANVVTVETMPARIERLEKAATSQFNREWIKKNTPQVTKDAELDVAEVRAAEVEAAEVGDAAVGDAEVGDADNQGKQVAALPADSTFAVDVARTASKPVVVGTPPVPTAEQLDALNSRLKDAREDLARAKKNQRNWHLASSVSTGVKTVLPKTQETVALLERWLVDLADLPKPPNSDADEISPFGGANQAEVQSRMQTRIRGQSLWWVLGTSLGFEAVILAIAVWIFRRRDF